MAERTHDLRCEECGSRFKRGRSGPVPRYCSASCRARACTARAKADGRHGEWLEASRARRLAKREPKPCPYCGAPMLSPRRVQCGGAECTRRHKSRRAIEWKRANPTKRTCPPFRCAQCDKGCTPGKDVAAHATKFCGRACKQAWHTSHAVPTPECLARATRRRRRAAAIRQLERAATGVASNGRVWVAGACVECGHAFVSQRRDSVACSDACSRKQRRRRGRRRYRAKYGSDSHRSRARRFGVAYEPISVVDIFERDEYVCGICGEATSRGAKVPDPRAPTVDHVVPMSKGGPHLRSNVQCACFECNWRKADRDPVPALAAAA
jgi:hypothetical protein